VDDLELFFTSLEHNEEHKKNQQIDPETVHSTFESLLAL